jgi:putative intracellular protease/amidase
MNNARILIVLTSHDRLGDTGDKTGFWLEEFAAPYYVLQDAGAGLTLASPAGGQPPVDPKSARPEWQTDATRRFAADPAARGALAATLPLARVDSAEFDALFIPGGHGPMWDYPGNRVLADLIEAFDDAGKPIAAVCHGPAALVAARQRNGAPLLAGRRVTAFTDREEHAVGLAAVVPFLLEQRLRAQGVVFVSAPDFDPFVVTDGHLITGQNPASSAPAAHALLQALQAQRVAVAA